MRQRLLTTICVAALAVTSLIAQSAHPSAGSVAQSRATAHASLPVAPTSQPSIVDATSLGSPINLNNDWRVGISSDSAVANPAFDDSTWAVHDIRSTFNDVSDSDTPDSAQKPAGPNAQRNPRSTAGSRRYAWFRLHIKLALNHPPLALLIELPVSQSTSFGITTSGFSPEVFADGQLIIPQGPHADSPQRYQAVSRIYDLDVPPQETSLVLVVRIPYVAFGYGAYTGFFSGHTFRLGEPADLQRELDLWSNGELFERLPRIIYCSLLAVLAIFLFVLYFAQKGHNEYLWLALHELVQAPIGFIELAGASARVGSLLYAALLLQLAVIAAYFFFEFLVAFLVLKRRWYIRWLRYTAPILLFVGPVLLLVGHRGPAIALLAIVFLCSLVWVLAWAIFIFVTLLVSALKRNFEAALLLIPLILSVVGMIEPIAAAALSEDTGATYDSPLTFLAGPIPFHFAAIADFTGILVILTIVFARFLRIHRDQERVSNELAAARTVQELLIPREKLATPGFEVDSVYSPASEVGGDFFHVQTADGGMLVVIGDVAGKGLKAAMNVSLIMGALRHTEERSPARILASLNRVLAGTQSFTTCQAVWFGNNGEMVIANAGHLPPYINSQEIDLPGGLPLGVLAEISYDEARFFLHPGDRVLLLSDGVVEARQPSGELFGFDRLRNLSQQSAFYLAEAAKAFGQEDDITVLTVRREAEALAA